MSMRSDWHKRAGATLLGLLLLLHLGSGLLHACCLGEPDVAESADAHHVDAGHADAGHADAGHAAHHVAMDATDEAADLHGGSHAGHEDDDCQGICAWCCSTVDQIVLQTPMAAAERAYDALPSALDAPSDAVLPPSPAFLLPPANAPPGLSTLLG